MEEETYEHNPRQEGNKSYFSKNFSRKLLKQAIRNSLGEDPNHGRLDTRNRLRAKLGKPPINENGCLVIRSEQTS